MVKVGTDVAAAEKGRGRLSVALLVSAETVPRRDVAARTVAAVLLKEFMPLLMAAHVDVQAVVGTVLAVTARGKAVGAVEAARGKVKQNIGI